MFLIQMYTIAFDITPLEALNENMKSPIKIAKEYKRWEAVFGKTKWSWIFPIAPDNNDFDPHFTGQDEEVGLPNYEELTNME